MRYSQQWCCYTFNYGTFFRPAGEQRAFRGSYNTPLLSSLPLLLPLSFLPRLVPFLSPPPLLYCSLALSPPANFPGDGSEINGPAASWQLSEILALNWEVVRSRSVTNRRNWNGGYLSSTQTVCHEHRHFKWSWFLPRVMLVFLRVPDFGGFSDVLFVGLSLGISNICLD